MTMPKHRIIGLSSFKDRHGRTRYRYRRDGKDVYIKQLDGEDFATAVKRITGQDAELAEVREAVSHHSPPKGWIYFIAGGDDLIKIGYTSNEVAGRLKSLKIGSPVPLSLVAKIPGRWIDEQRLHERFSSSRSHGEWFKRTAELESLIETAAEAHGLDMNEPTEHLLSKGCGFKWKKSI